MFCFEDFQWKHTNQVAVLVLLRIRRFLTVSTFLGFDREPPIYIGIVKYPVAVLSNPHMLLQAPQHVIIFAE